MKLQLSLQPCTRRRSRPLYAGVLCSVLGTFGSYAGSAFADVLDAGAPDAAPPETTFPERPLGLFPNCTSEQDTFCIESAEKDDADILHSSYVIGASFLDANSINWAIGAGSQYGELPAEDLGATFHFVIRTGDLQPLSGSGSDPGASGSGNSTSSGGATAGSSNVDTSTAGAGGSSPTPDVTAGSGGGAVSPSSTGKRRSSGCALGTPSTDPVAALAAAGLIALLGTRRRASSPRRR